MIWLWAGFFGSILFLCVSFSALYQLNDRAMITRFSVQAELEGGVLVGGIGHRNNDGGLLLKSTYIRC